MDGLEFFHLHVAAGKSFNQVILRETKLVEVSSVWTKILVEFWPVQVLFLIPICFIFIKAIIGLTVASGWKLARDEKRLVTLNRFQQVPCKNCRFFTNNLYLKCAVQPSTALTKQALNCPDYWPQEHPGSSLPVTSVVSATVFDPQTQSWYHLRNLFEHSESVWAVAPFLHR